MKMSGGIGNSSMGGPCNCEGCQKIRKKETDIKEIEEKMQSNISIIRQSVAQSIKRLRKECKETVQYLEREAAEKIEKIKKGCHENFSVHLVEVLGLFIEFKENIYCFSNRIASV